MSGLSILVWGFGATILLTTLLAGSQGAGLTRMNLPFMIGTIFTPNRDKAKLIGFGIHLLNGWIFAFIYAVFLQAMGGPTWWRGMIIGFAHSAFLLMALMSLLPAVHPRMASEKRGPTATQRLEPPGFLGLHYGYQTPLTVLLAHLLYGAVLGFFLGRF